MRGSSLIAYLTSSLTWTTNEIGIGVWLHQKNGKLSTMPRKTGKEAGKKGVKPAWSTHNYFSIFKGVPIKTGRKVGADPVLRTSMTLGRILTTIAVTAGAVGIMNCPLLSFECPKAQWTMTAMIAVRSRYEAQNSTLPSQLSLSSSIPWRKTLINMASCLRISITFMQADLKTPVKLAGT